VVPAVNLREGMMLMRVASSEGGNYSTYGLV